MSPVKLISRQESNPGQLTSGNTENREKDTCLYYSKLELGEEAHKEVHKETHLWRARAPSHSSSPLCYRQWPRKHWPPPLHPGGWSHEPALPTSIGWVGFRWSFCFLQETPLQPGPTTRQRTEEGGYSYVERKRVKQREKKMQKKMWDQERSPAIREQQRGAVWGAAQLSSKAVSKETL